MGRKRTKKKRGTGKGISKIPVLLSALFFLGAVISVSSYLFFVEPFGEKTYPYEEFHSNSSTLSIQVSRIDKTVYECLRKNRVPKENIQFVAVIPKKEKRMETLLFLKKYSHELKTEAKIVPVSQIVG